jgi:hypothetical protein
MAKLGKNEGLLPQHCNGVVLANLGALTTMCTACFVHFWDQDTNFLVLFKDRLEEQMSIGRLDITV